MRVYIAYSLLIALFPASAALSETCVSDTFDRPLPGAVDIEVRHADVPSPRFPGVWQEGWIDGFFYRIWSNKEAVLQSNRKSPFWSISVLCEGGTTACQQTIEGIPSSAALETAGSLGKCLSDAGFTGAEDPVTAAPPTSEVSTETPPQPTEAATASAETTPAEPAAKPPCGLAVLPEGSPGLTLQRLLVEAGGDPGQLDGLVGPKTTTALLDVLGPSASALDQAAAISALDAYLCETDTQSN